MTEKEKFWTKDFIIALIGWQCLFMSITLFFIFPLYLEQFGATKGRIGLIMGIHSLMAILTRPVFGRLIDIKGRKVISLIGMASLIVVIPFYHLIQDAGTLPLLLRALTGMGWGVSMTATITICSDMAPVQRLARSMGIIGVAGLVAVAIGPLLGEEIVRHYGYGGLFNTSFVFLCLAFVCILFTKETFKLNDGNLSTKPKLTHNLTFLVLCFIATLPIVHGAVRGSVINFIALFGKSIPVDRIGPFFVAFSAAAILTRVFFGGLSDKYGRKVVLFPAVVVISLNMFLIAYAGNLWMFTLAGFIGGLGQGLIFPALSTYMIDLFGQANKGLALSLYLTFFDIGMGSGSAFFGWIIDLYGFRIMFISAGLIFFFVSLIFMLKAPNPQRLDSVT
ncbi:MFS transporter [Acidobacteriota bacterium]